jgi:signal transduction histidine kinase/HPt (histidine-containing phosphotransfer) domain-containing protein
MWVRLRALLAPPIFPGDEEKTRTAAILHLLLLNYAAIIAVLPASLYLYFRTPNVPPFAGATLASLGIAYALLRRGHVQLASFLTVSGGWIAITVFMAMTGGLSTAPVPFYLVSTAFAGLLLGSRAAVLTAIISSLTGLALTLFPLAYLDPPPRSTYWLDLALALYLITITLTVWQKNLRSALATARQRLAERQRAEAARQQAEDEVRQLNVQLEQRVHERTRELEAEIARRQQTETELRQAHAEAAAANHAKSDFLATMSHELRTPINGLLGLSRLALNTQLLPPQQDYLEKIQFSAQSLLTIVNDLLDLSKIEAGKLEMERIPFNLAQVVDHVSDLMQPRAHEKGIRFSIQIAPDVPAPLLGDPLRLSQILLNLTSNAVKFTDRGDVTVSVAAAPLTPSAVSLLLTVRDTGVGITPEQLTRLFQPFTQAESSTSRKYGGTGLGLTITNRLVELMGGTLSVESQPGQGSTFTATVPLAVPSAASEPSDEHSPPAAEAGYEGWSLRGARVLLVEDNAINLQVAAETLAGLGVTVLTATNGQVAVDQVAALGETLDAVLMDVQMPVMDGYAATRLIRERLGRHMLPIIALTAYAHESEKQHCREAGMDDYISKPVSPESLAAKLLRWIQRPGAPSTPAVPQEPSAPPSSVPDLNASLRLEDVPGLHLSSALHRLRGDRLRLANFLRVFVNQYGEVAERLRPMLARGDSADMHRLLHSFRGTSATVGLTVAADLARQASAALHQSDPTQTAQFVEQLGACLALTVAAIDRLSPTDP